MIEPNVKYWKWLAEASNTEEGTDSLCSIPWWHFLKDSKSSRHMSGGIGNQIAGLQDGGIILS
jgi:hypothetical protein